MNTYPFFIMNNQNPRYSSDQNININQAQSNPYPNINEPGIIPRAEVVTSLNYNPSIQPDSYHSNGRFIQGRYVIPQPNCPSCSGSGYIVINSQSYPCGKCYDLSKINPNKSPGIFERIANFVKGIFKPRSHCSWCKGRGYLVGNNYNVKYCYDCAREDGHCYKCDNSGIRIKDGAKCRCHHP
jgi:hypothetical protein